MPSREVVATSELRQEGAPLGRRLQIGKDPIRALSVQMDANGKTSRAPRVHACTGLAPWLLLASALPLGGGCQVGGPSDSGGLQTPLSQTVPSPGNEVRQPGLTCQLFSSNQEGASSGGCGHVLLSDAQTAERPTYGGTQQTQEDWGPRSNNSARSDSQHSGTTARAASIASVDSGENQRIQYALELAQRGATYSARAELIKVLRLVSRALDAEEDASVHGRALRAGLQALREADDFAVDGSRPGANLEVSHVVRSHETPVLKDADQQDLTPLLALQYYYMYAEGQLAVAAGKEPVASEALTALGRLQPLLSDPNMDSNPLATPKAMVMYRAALRIDSRNFVAAHELGVSLARCGQWDDARRHLLHALSIANQPETWANLSVVFNQLGESAEADRAREISESLVADVRRGGEPKKPTVTGDLARVQWIDSGTFAQTSVKDAVTFSSYGSEPPASVAAEPPKTPGLPEALARIFSGGTKDLGSTKAARRF